MKGNLLQLAFGSAVLVIGAGLEELLPKILGVGFPVLLTAVPFLTSARQPLLTSLSLAVAAGALEDALSGLPLMTSVSFFLVLAVLSRRLGASRPLALLAYPGYQLWLAIWTDAAQGVFSRLFLSFPIGALTALVVGAVIIKVAEGAAVNEQD